MPERTEAHLPDNWGGYSAQVTRELLALLAERESVPGTARGDVWMVRRMLAEAWEVGRDSEPDAANPFDR
jgi:hypothetical protein